MFAVTMICTTLHQTNGKFVKMAKGRYFLEAFDSDIFLSSLLTQRFDRRTLRGGCFRACGLASWPSGPAKTMASCRTCPSRRNVLEISSSSSCGQPGEPAATAPARGGEGRRSKQARHFARAFVVLSDRAFDGGSDTSAVPNFSPQYQIFLPSTKQCS